MERPDTQVSPCCRARAGVTKSSHLGDLGVIPANLPEKVQAQRLLVQIGLLLERQVHSSIRRGFERRLPNLRKERMLQRRSHADPLVGTEDEHLLEEVTTRLIKPRK